MTFFMLLPDEKIEHEDEEKNGEDSPGVHVNLLDLGETVAGRLLLRDGDWLVDLVAEPLLLVLVADHGHRAVLAHPTPSLQEKWK